jgi:hypothetical protein
MPESIAKQRRDVIIIERIECDAAISSVSHEPHLPERAKGMRYDGLRHLEDVRDI